MPFRPRETTFPAIAGARKIGCLKAGLCNRQYRNCRSPSHHGRDLFRPSAWWRQPRRGCPGWTWM